MSYIIFLKKTKMTLDNIDGFREEDGLIYFYDNKSNMILCVNKKEIRYFFRSDLPLNKEGVEMK